MLEDQESYDAWEGERGMRAVQTRARKSPGQSGPEQRSCIRKHLVIAFAYSVYYKYDHVRGCKSPGDKSHGQ